MNTVVKKYLLLGGGAILGAVAGYTYWRYIGCMSGTCAITSSPVNSSLYGAFMGGLLMSTFDKKRTTNKTSI
jgi:hypothetical protein